VAELWFPVGSRKRLRTATRSPGTVGTYRSILDRQVLPGLGEFRVRELTVAPLDRFSPDRSTDDGAGYREDGSVCRLQRRRPGGAAMVPCLSNPVRDISPLDGGAQEGASCRLTADEREQWFAQLDADDVCGAEGPCRTCVGSYWPLAYGIGEALGVYWSDVDLDQRIVRIDHTVLRVKGKGLRRSSTKSAARRSGRCRCLCGSWNCCGRAGLADPAADGPVFADSLGGLRGPVQHDG